LSDLVFSAGFEDYALAFLMHDPIEELQLMGLLPNGLVLIQGFHFWLFRLDAHSNHVLALLFFDTLLTKVDFIFRVGLDLRCLSCLL
jgi:hypothetical protein